MDQITQDTVTDALNMLESHYKRWLLLKAVTDAEKELAQKVIANVDHARTKLSELMARPPA